MSKVQCSKITFKNKKLPGCQGAVHDPRCAVYIDAIRNWNPPEVQKKPRKNGSGKHRPPDAPPLTDEQRAEISRKNGTLGGRPKYENPLPIDLVRAIRSAKTNVKKDFKDDPAVAGVAGYALERIALVAAGKVSTRKSPSVLKASVRLREEFCDPVESTMNVKGGLDIGAAFAKIKERQGK